MDFNHKSFYIIKKEIPANSEPPPLIPISPSSVISYSPECLNQEAYKIIDQSKFTQPSNSEFFDLQNQMKDQITIMQQAILERLNSIESTVTKQHNIFAKKIHKIHKETARNTIILEKIMVHFGIPEPEMEVEIVEENLDICHLPMKTEDELFICEEKLQNSIFNNRMQNHFQKMKGENAKNLNKILPKIVSDEVMREYNFNGTHGKKAFSKLRLFDVMRAAWSSDMDKIETILRQAIHVANSRFLKRHKTHLQSINNT